MSKDTIVTYQAPKCITARDKESFEARGEIIGGLSEAAEPGEAVDVTPRLHERDDVLQGLLDLAFSEVEVSCDAQFSHQMFLSTFWWADWTADWTEDLNWSRLNVAAIPA
jgi:hypothetical protein